MNTGVAPNRPLSSAEARTSRAGRRLTVGRLPVWATLVAAVAWLAVTIGLRPLAQPDEGRYIGVAFEMMRSGHWMVPTLDGMPFFHKPPLFYWLSAGAMSLFGPHDFAGRVPPLFGAALVSTTLFLFARRWSGSTVARAALLVLVTMPGFYAGAQYANLDMLVAGCVGSTVLAAAYAAMILMGLPSAASDDRPARPGRVVGLEPSNEARRWIVAAWAAAALAVLAKGLIGVVLPAATITLWLLVQRRPSVIAKLLWWPALVVFAAIALPWFVAMQLRFAEFFDYFIVEQHVRRFTQQSFNNVGPWWFYIAVLAALMLPWLPWFAQGVWRHARGRLRDRRRPPAGSSSDVAVRRLMWTWLLTMLVFFSLPASKLVGYIIVVLAPLAWLVADAASVGRPKKGVRPSAGIAGASSSGTWWVATAGVAGLCCLAVVIAALHFVAPGSGDVAVRLRALHRAGEPVLALDRYPYDLAFEADLREPIPVVGDWQDPQLALRDNWRKELLDAGRFAPDVAARMLIDRGELRRTVCRAPVTWLLASVGAVRDNRWPLLSGRAAVATSGDLGLWKFEMPIDAGTSAACTGRRE